MWHENRSYQIKEVRNESKQLLIEFLVMRDTPKVTYVETHSAYKSKWLDNINRVIGPSCRGDKLRTYCRQRNTVKLLFPFSKSQHFPLKIETRRYENIPIVVKMFFFIQSCALLN